MFLFGNFLEYNILHLKDYLKAFNLTPAEVPSDISDDIKVKDNKN